MYGGNWSVADVLYVFVILFFVIAFILTLVVITRKNECEEDRLNVVRAQLLLLLVIGFVGIVILAQRQALHGAVAHLLQ